MMAGDRIANLEELVEAQARDRYSTSGSHRDRIGHRWVLVFDPEEVSKSDSLFGQRIVQPEQDLDLDNIRQILELLPTDERELIYLHYYDQLSSREIAARTGINYRTVQRMINRILEKIRAFMGPAAAPKQDTAAGRRVRSRPQRSTYGSRPG